VHDVKLIAFYLPQFHPIPENDAWWGEGFTEWVNVRRARPNFVSHYQPHVPAELGYYDLTDPGVRLAQAELAKQHGIHGFCYYYYWFNGRRLLNRPLDEVLASGAPDFPFCVCWANENWTRRWDGGDDELLIAQDYSPDNERALIGDLVPLFRDPRYIHIRGRPLVLVYRANLMADPGRATGIFRRETRAAGLPEPYLGMVHVAGMPPPSEWGFDAAVEFPPHAVQAETFTRHIERLNPRFAGEVWDYVSAARNSIAKPLPAYPYFRGVMVSWDNTPRLQDNSQIFVNAHPDNYRRWLAAMIAQTRATHPPEDRVVFVNAWNEWGEGCHLEPDERYGRAWLEATRAALAAA